MKTAEFGVVVNARRAAHSRFDHYNSVMTESKHVAVSKQARKDGEKQRLATNKPPKK
ncbi:hypothetical protein [Verminephrobacter eiseniae]|uniref:hypothetical protein n=1 Tax=Verminephrobacter eiseniae TaxID=364317 RepID=UPI0022380379|nr:hypothetical protein [Verminephrobacter eiseniae]